MGHSSRNISTEGHSVSKTRTTLSSIEGYDCYEDVKPRNTSTGLLPTDKMGIAASTTDQSATTKLICNNVSTTISTTIQSFKVLATLICQIISFLAFKITDPFLRNKALESDNVKKARLKELCEMPGPRPLPFFGTLLTSSALKSSDLMKVNEEREKMYGPLVKEEHFWNYPLIMVLGTDEIKKVVKANPLMRPAMEILTMYRTRRPDRYNTFGLVNSQGSIWKKLHATFSTVALNRKFVRSLLPVYNDISNEVIDCLARESSPTTALPQVISKLIMEVSFYSVLGKRMGFVRKDLDEAGPYRLFSNCHEIYWHAFHKSMYGFPWWKYFPSKVWDEFTAAEDKLIDMVSKIIDQILTDDEAGGILAGIKKDKVAREDLNVVILELITGATEPVFHAVIITLYWISKHDEVYNRVLEELKEQLPTKDSIVDENVLANLPYLKACVTETFRICPTTCNVARILEEEFQLGEYRLPPYTSVILQTWHACLKDTSFYRAKEYLPERWLLQDGVPPFSPHERQVMCNFGIGTRACPGRKIATQLIHTFLSKILRKFKVKFTDDLELRYEWLLVVKEPVTIELEENDF